MQAVVWKSANKVVVEKVDDPKIQEETDAILRLTTAAICGSDLHMYEGRAPIEPGQIFGHENMGIIEKVGSAVTSIKVGDRVVLPFNIGCGFCFNCTRGFSNACLTVNPQSHGGGYGYSGMGPHPGGQAELVRVPYADYNCLKLPGTPNDEFEDDFIMLADVFPTGYHATEQAHVKPGDSVAIFGAGPVGLLAALSAKIKGASEIYVVDNVKERLELAKRIGATPVDFSQGDAVDQILALRKPHVESGAEPARRRRRKDAGRSCARSTRSVTKRSSKAQAIPRTIGNKTRPRCWPISCGLRIQRATSASLASIFRKIRVVRAPRKEGTFSFPLGDAWNKGISIEMGQAPVKRYNVYLRDLILAGVARPSIIVSQRLPLSEAPDAYKQFEARADGFTKVLLKPQQAA